MNLHRVAPRHDVPHDINVIIKMPMHAPPLKHEMNKQTGAMFIDRVLSTAMYYPCHCGYIPHTLAGDGDLVDMRVRSPAPLMSSVVVRCRLIGMLKMQDDGGRTPSRWR